MYHCPKCVKFGAIPLSPCVACQPSTKYFSLCCAGSIRRFRRKRNSVCWRAILRSTGAKSPDKTYFSEMVDPYLYLGPTSLLLVEPGPAEIFLNKDYMCRSSFEFFQNASDKNGFESRSEMLSGFPWSAHGPPPIRTT